MDAIGVIMMGTGAFLLYASYKGEHPWTLFVSELSISGNPVLSTPGVAAQGSKATVAPHGGVGYTSPYDSVPTSSLGN